MRTSIPIFVGTAIIASASLALADDAGETKHVVVGAKVGGIAPFDGLSPFVSGGIEAGYLITPEIGVVLAIDYTQPSKTGTEMDPRVTGGTYSWKLTEQELGIMPTFVYRMSSMKGVIPYGGIGPRLLLLESTVGDNGGMPAIAKTTEKSTKLGVGVPLGVELPAGPGSLLGEVLLQYGAIDHTATGSSNTAGVSLSIGYRAMF